MGDTEPFPEACYSLPTYYLDSEHPRVAAFARETAGGADTPREQAARLFAAVRDGVRYNPYPTALAPAAFQASAVLAAGEGFCLPKALLLAAAARALHIPSRLGYADVKNHLASKRLLALMRTDVFAYHAFTELWIEGAWRKATPTFDRALCEKFGVETLQFDGLHDALFAPFDREGRRHMEYLRRRGHAADFSHEAMLAAWREAYPHFFDGETSLPRGDLAAEIDAERRG